MSTTIHLDPRSLHTQGRTCPSCDGPLVPGDEVCPHCGVSLRLPDPREGMELAAGRYRLDRQIAHGGTSAVYRALELEVNRTVAVKILDAAHTRNASSVARFREEVIKAREIQHPHAVDILDFGQMEDGTLFMVMELVRGVSLDQLIKDGGPMAETRVIRLMKQVADCLGVAHRQGLVHRDLKPENIMVEPERNGIPDWVLVLDFGIAKAFGRPGETTTRTGTLIGTPHYMSPEQCQGKSLDARSDVYALGVVMYEMLTAQRPFQTTSDSVIPLLMKHIEERPRPMRAVRTDLDVSRELERLVMGALSKDPNWRPANGTDLYTALDRVERIRTGKNFDRTPRTANEVRRAARARQRGKGGLTSAVAMRLRSETAEPSPPSTSVIATLAVLAGLGGVVWIGYRTSRPDVPGGATAAPVAAPIERTRPSAPAIDPEVERKERVAVDVAALLAQGRHALESRNFPEAAERFELARQADPRNPEPWLGLGRATAALGRQREAASYLRKVNELVGNDPRHAHFATQGSRLLDEIHQVDRMLTEARGHETAGRDAQAIDRYRAYLAARSEDAGAQLALGRLLAKLGRLSEAESTLRDASRLAPAEAQPHHELGGVLLALSRREEAIEELKLALELDPDREDTKRYLGLARSGRRP